MVSIDPDVTVRGIRNIPRKVRDFTLASADRKFLVGAILALLAIRLLAMFWLPFVDSTEARYAEIARKMVETNDWITPQFDYGVPFWGKPPLHTWLSALGMKIFGVGHFGARIFIFLPSIGVLSLCYAWVRRHRSMDEALVAVTVLVSSLLFFGASAFVMTDMVMVLGTTLSMIGFYNCATDRSSRSFWGHLFFVGLAIGMLAKGPVAVVLTGIPVTLWLLAGNRWRLLARLPWTTGLLTAAVLTVPWYVAAEIKTPGFLRYFFVGEHYERFVVSGWQGDLYGSGHARPMGQIWIDWLVMFAPWTLFVAVLGFRARRVRAVVQADTGGWHSYLFFWVLAPLLLFTPAANILSAYVLPGIPAAAILLTSIWAGVFGAPGRWVRMTVAAAVGVMAVLYLTIVSLAYWAPATVSLKTARELVARANAADPDTRISYWSGRSYSAEFYTRGKVRFLAEPGDLTALRSNGVPDAVGVPPQMAPQAAQLLGPGFEDLGPYGRYHLFIENTAPEGGGA